MDNPANRRVGKVSYDFEAELSTGSLQALQRIPQGETFGDTDLQQKIDLQEADAQQPSHMADAPNSSISASKKYDLFCCTIS